MSSDLVLKLKYHSKIVNLILHTEATDNMNTINPALSIPAFYANRSIFITGGTGFMGKVLIEKLLRSCPDIREIFVLIRSMKERSIHDRLKDMLTLPLFDQLHEERPSVFDKLIPVKGNIFSKELGLSPDDRHMLIERVSIIIHGAAIVKFNSTLKTIILCNIRATRDICILAKEMKDLCSLTYIGTAYCQSDKILVDEILYPVDLDWRHVIKIAESAIDDDMLKIFTAKYIDNFNNCYLFSKRIAEQIIQHYSKTLPCVIVRPSVVIATLEDPFPGWVDSINGPAMINILIAKGITQTQYADDEKRRNYIPVDLANKIILVSTWKRGLKSLAEDPILDVYNCTNIEINLHKDQILMKHTVKQYLEMPHTDIIWQASIHITNNIVWYYILVLFLHLLPAILLDGILKLCKRSPRLLKIQRNIFLTNFLLTFVFINEWNFQTKNSRNLVSKIPLNDIASFGFNALYEKMDEVQVSKNIIIGYKKYVLKEYPLIQEAGIKHLKRITLISKIVKKSFFIGAIWILYRNNVFQWILNVILYIVDRLILGKLLGAMVF